MDINITLVVISLIVVALVVGKLKTTRDELKAANFKLSGFRDELETTTRSESKLADKVSELGRQQRRLQDSLTSALKSAEDAKAITIAATKDKNRAMERLAEAENKLATLNQALNGVESEYLELQGLYSVTQDKLSAVVANDVFVRNNITLAKDETADEVSDVVFVSGAVWHAVRNGLVTNFNKIGAKRETRDAAALLASLNHKVVSID